MGTIIAFGELLLRLNTPNFQRFSQMKQLEATYAGAEANVAVACAHFGHKASLVTSLPDHSLTEAALRQLSYSGVDTRHILKKGRRMGVYYLESGFGSRPSSVIYDREGSSFSETAVTDYDWATIFEGADWLHLTGITPALSETLRLGIPDVIRSAREAGVKVSFDLNYRAKLWPVEEARESLMAILREVDLAMGSIHQVEPLLQIPSGDKCLTSTLRCARQICERYAVPACVLTVRENRENGLERRWAAGVFDGKSAESCALDYRILDPLGGGDAFSGGLLSGLMSGLSGEASMNLGVAAAAWKYSHQGDYLEASREEVESLLKGSGVAGTVLR